MINEGFMRGHLGDTRNVKKYWIIIRHENKSRERIGARHYIKDEAEVFMKRCRQTEDNKDVTFSLLEGEEMPSIYDKGE